LYEKNINRISDEAQSYLTAYPWEGNVRQLKNTVKSIVPLKTDDRITVNDLRVVLGTQPEEISHKFVSLEEHEQDYILKVLQSNNYNVKKTAEALGISRSRIYRKLKQIEPLQ
jgi:DNA-binding NtrC family response regulator